jgi:hypothetical protein
LEDQLEIGRKILDGLKSPGMDVVFVDETGTSGKPLSILASGFQLYCGVTFPSARYGEVRESLRSKLMSFGPTLKEFHATEIVNPKDASPWKAISIANRLEALQFLSMVLLEHASQIAYCYVSREQYPQLLAAAREVTEVNLSQKRGLRHVFFEILLAQLRARAIPTPIAIVSDIEKPLADAIRIRTVVDLPCLYQGGVIEVASEVEPGLQIVDFAAYVLNRTFHATLRTRKLQQTPFDERILATYEAVRPRLQDLLVT